MTNTAQCIGQAVEYTAVRLMEAAQTITLLLAQTAGTTANTVMVFAGTNTVFGHTAWDYALRQAPETRRDGLRRRRESARWSTAELKAEELLRSCLSRAQDEELTKYGWFDVPVKDRTYRVKRGVAGNVFLLGKDGREVERFCIHPSGVPAGDAMLAQKLLLETDERKFRSVANITPLR